MAKYILSTKATNDLRTIWNYTYDTWSETQADKYISEITLEIKKIPSDGTLFDREYNEIKKGLYGRRCNKHIIFYRINEDEDILVLRILHQMMDIKLKL